MHKHGAIQFVPALFWAGFFNVATGLAWDIPMCVQPMKTIAAVAITDTLTAAEVTAAGMLVSAVVLCLGVTRFISVVNQLVPLAVVRGLQLGLGLSLVRRASEQVFHSAGWLDPYEGSLLGVGFLLAILVMLQGRRWPAALIAFVVGLGLSFTRVVTTTDSGSLSFQLASPVYLSILDVRPADVASAAWRAALPQLPLTTLNSVISVCRLAEDLKPDKSVTRESVAVSVGVMNLLGCPLGAMPSCHGAGGLAGQWRFGARSGSSIVLLGAAKMTFAVLAGSPLLVLLQYFPTPILGAMLTFSGLELAQAGLQLGDSDALRGDEAAVAVATAGFTVGMGTGIGCIAGLVVSVVHVARDHLAKARAGGQGRDRNGDHGRSPSGDGPAEGLAPGRLTLVHPAHGPGGDRDGDSEEERDRGGRRAGA